MTAARLRSGAVAVAVFAAGLGLLWGIHRWRAPHRVPYRDAGAVAAAVRLGYLPNLTHAQAVLGIADGSFARALGSGVRLEPTVFNAGPSAVEALFAGAIDLTYIGPNPAINAHEKARGEVRVIAGAASGGAALVVRSESGIASAKDLKGRRLATPQLGNTQDVAARAWLRAQGVEGVEVLPVKNPDQLTLFLQKDLDAAWTVEPWVSRLVREAGGRVLVDERSLWPGGRFPTTLLLVRRSFLEKNPELVRRFLRTHIELTRRLQLKGEESRKALNAELERLTGKALRPEVLDDAFGRFEPTWDPAAPALARSAEQAFEQGYLGKTRPDLTGLFDSGPLNEVLREARLEPVR